VAHSLSSGSASFERWQTAFEQQTSKFFKAQLLAAGAHIWTKPFTRRSQVLSASVNFIHRNITLGNEMLAHLPGFVRIFGDRGAIILTAHLASSRDPRSFAAISVLDAEVDNGTSAPPARRGSR